ncbi:MAG: phage tail assembly protein [Firmicutes bacterium]|nr:phage tail assembly protein [Bacillota bacterium]MDY5855595.1 phage tail assembly protein [Anaerovoracaceae bacterium]
MAEKSFDYIVKLKKPYLFEGTEYTEIDLSGLDELTTDALCRAQAIIAAEGDQPMVPESNYRYCMLLASMVTGKPIEFFMRLPAKDGISVKGRIFSYFFSDADSE